MLLPATLPDPDEPTSRGGWHCPSCEPNTPRATRLKMHCGLLPRAEWSKDRKKLPRAISGQPYTHDECPGSLVRRPEVEEAAQAYDALEAGILDRYDPLRLHVITEAAQLVRRSFNLHTAERLKEIKKKGRRA